MAAFEIGAARHVYISYSACSSCRPKVVLTWKKGIVENSLSKLRITVFKVFCP